MAKPVLVPDPWSALRKHTAARIALGRAGGSLPTREVSDFATTHAAARDAVHTPLNLELLQKDLAPLGLECLLLNTQAADRQTYLQRPDLGRQLDPQSTSALGAIGTGSFDIALIVGDGLSAPAAQTQAAPLLSRLVPLLRRDGWRLAPLCIVRHARVAIEDPIGAALGVRLALILLGERPGLGTAQSLGAYFVYQPRTGCTDAQRNCVSNIRPDGLPPADAAAALHYLITLSLQRQLSGVLLKDERGMLEGTRTGELLDR
jgi:ethanolamine ammonia-lyase small subunit